MGFFRARFLFLSFQLFIFCCAPSVSHAGDNEIFNVGMVLPLTGPAADYGDAIKNCIVMAQNDRPDLFEKVRFIFEDAGYDPKSAITAMRKLVESHKVNLAATWGVPFCKALAPVAESSKIPLIGLCIDPETAAGRRYVIRFMNTTDEYMRLLAQYLAKRGKNKIGLIVTEQGYLEELSAALQRNLAPGQTVSIVDSLPQTENDFRTQIVKLNKSNFDVIGVLLFAGQISTFYRQAKGMGFSKPTFGSNFFESKSELESADGTMNGALISTMSLSPEFVSRYTKLFGAGGQLAFGGPAYEFALAVGELFNNVPMKLKAEEIISAFSRIENRAGVAAGPYSYVHDSKVGQYFRFPLEMQVVTTDGFKRIE